MTTQLTTMRKNFLSAVQREARYHGTPLILLTATILFGQYLELHWGINAILTSDSPGYYLFAKNLYRSHFHHLPVYVNSFRTPGYPFFLGIIFVVTGLFNYNAVVVMQSVFLAAAFYEIYLLAFLIMRQRWLAVGIAIFMSLDLYLLDNEIRIMTEAISLWAIVTLFLLIERYVTKESWVYAIALGVAMFLTIMIRPIFSFLPPVVLVVLALYNIFRGPLRQQWHDRALRQRWLRLACIGAVVYIGMYGYMKTNQAENHYYGISYVSNVNLLGKIIVYGMVHDSATPYYDSLHNALITYYDTGNREPWYFLQHTPYAGHAYDNAAGLSLSIIKRHPVEYGMHSISDIITTWQTPIGPDTRDYNGAIGVDIRQMELSLFGLLYLLLPLALIGAGYLVWRTRSERMATLLFLSALVVVAQLVTIGVGAYGGFDRLRLPVDWIVPFVIVGVIAGFVRLMLAAPQPAPTVADPDETVKRPVVITTSNA